MIDSKTFILGILAIILILFTFLKEGAAGTWGTPFWGPMIWNGWLY